MPRIAARAGVSLRSVFQHFADREALYAAAAERQTERIAAADAAAGRRRAGGARRALAAQRARVFEVIAPVRRAALLMAPYLARDAGRLAAFLQPVLRRDLARLFAAGARVRSVDLRGAPGCWLRSTSPPATRPGTALRRRPALGPTVAAAVVGRTVRACSWRRVANAVATAAMRRLAHDDGRRAAAMRRRPGVPAAAARRCCWPGLAPGTGGRRSSCRCRACSIAGGIRSGRRSASSGRPGPPCRAGRRRRRPPNIVLILADDLGYNDLTFGGGGVADGAVPTPNIDSIARDGVTFTNGYTGNATCAPSRASIVTGRYATRFGFEFTPAPVQFQKLLGHTLSSVPPARCLFTPAREGRPAAVGQQVVPGASETTIAELLKSQGYRTLFFGKWHLGETANANPRRAASTRPWASSPAPRSTCRRTTRERRQLDFQDFDPIDKFLWGTQRYSAIWNGGERFAPRGYLTDYYTDEAIAVIRANKHQPFFLYLEHWGVHTPMQATQQDFDAVAHVEGPPRLRRQPPRCR